MLNLARFVDTHCHLNFNSFQEDLDTVLNNAWQAGIERILMPAIDIETCRQVIDLCDRDARLFAAVGIHPNEAATWDHATRDQLLNFARHPRVLAIGEIGLDYYRERAPHAAQKAILQQQLALAGQVYKPVLIHSRQSMHDLWPLLMDWQDQLVRQDHPLAGRCGVLHSYDGDLATAHAASQHGFMIGISGPLTFRNAPEKQAVAAALPLESLLLETDAPFLTPHPFRGRRNEPAYIPLIAEKLAELHQQPLSVVAEVTFANADRLLGWR